MGGPGSGPQKGGGKAKMGPVGGNGRGVSRFNSSHEMPNKEFTQRQVGKVMGGPGSGPHKGGGSAKKINVAKRTLRPTTKVVDMRQALNNMAHPSTYGNKGAGKVSVKIPARYIVTKKK